MSLDIASEIATSQPIRLMDFTLSTRLVLGTDGIVRLTYLKVAEELRRRLFHYVKADDRQEWWFQEVSLSQAKHESFMQQPHWASLRLVSSIEGWMEIAVIDWEIAERQLEELKLARCFDKPSDVPVILTCCIKYGA